MDYAQCAQLLTNKIITAAENGRKLTLNNPSERAVNKVTVDGCLFSNADLARRCDYLFEIFTLAKPKNIEWVIYLELKGRHIEDAYAQLVATMDKFKSEHKGTRKECYIISSRVPHFGPSVQQLNSKLIKDKQAKLVVKSNQAHVLI